MKELELKYGCNPNQKPSRIYMETGEELPIKVLNGRPGYINFLDAFNGWQLVSELKKAAAPAGDTCLKEVAAGSPVASFSSLTSCQPLNASRKLIYPGLPQSTLIGSSLPSAIKMRDGFWFGLHPYFNSSSFIFIPPVYPFKRMNKQFCF